MSLISTVSQDGQVLTIRITDTFGFEVGKAFRKAYEQGDQKTKYVIDLEDTNYMDSSSLGMLLVLREHAGGDYATINIINTSPELHKLFKLARFDKLFAIQKTATV